MPRVIGMIPARFKSLRFPGKVLADILGKSLLQRTYDQAIQSKRLSRVVVATDDQNVYDHVQSFGGEVFMSDPSHLTGTDRIAEVARLHMQEADIIVNVQADEPCLNPTIIDVLVDQLIATDEAMITTAITPIKDASCVADPSIVKCVCDKRGRALYFSRSAIPYKRHANDHPYYRHIGIYCFRKHFLLDYIELAAMPLQQTEDLEQLKILEHGHPIYVSVVEDEGIGVDTPDDIKKVEKLLCQKS